MHKLKLNDFSHHFIHRPLNFSNTRFLSLFAWKSEFHQAQTKKETMFLRSQFFFYRIYFDLLNRTNSFIFTWNPKKECFEMFKSVVPKSVSYASICFNSVHSFAASYIFLVLWLKKTEPSTISIAFHFLGLTATCYSFLWRSLYVIKASELICIMNKIILLEKLHFRSKPIYVNTSKVTKNKM